MGSLGASSEDMTFAFAFLIFQLINLHKQFFFFFINSWSWTTVLLAQSHLENAPSSKAAASTQPASSRHQLQTLRGSCQHLTTS